MAFPTPTLDGLTMAGDLTLAGAPTTNLHAATKAYADLKLALAGGTLTGSVVSTTSIQAQGGLIAGSSVATTGANISINGAVANQRYIQWNTAGSARMRMGVSSEAESGSNAGSNLFLNLYSDAGALVGSAMTISRATLQTTIPALKVGKTFTYSGGAPDVESAPIHVTSVFTGTTDASGWVGYNRVDVSTDTLAAGSSQQAIGWYHTQNWGGTGMTGGRTAIHAGLTQRAAVTAGGNFQGGLFYSTAAFNAGGTDVYGGALGVAFGGALYGSLQSGATNWRGVAGLEIDIGIDSGASAASIGGLQIARWSTHSYVPPEYDWNYGFRLADQNNNLTTTGARVGFQFGGSGGGGQWPIAADGKLIAASVSGTYTTVPMAALDGIDFNVATFSGSFLRSRGFRVDGNGGVRVGTASLTYTIGTAVDLDCKGSEVSAATVATGGSGLWVNAMLVDDATGTVLQVATVSGTAAATFTIYRKGLSDSPPSNPVSTFRVVRDGPTRAVATAPTVNLTWATQSLLRVNTTGGTLQFGSGIWSANGTVATAMSNLGPSGSHTTIQEWFVVKNASGTIRYIPAF